MKTLLHFCLLLQLGFTSAGENESWPGFRGTGNSHTDVPGLPEQWSETEHISWRAKLIGEGQSSPVIAGGLVFVMSTGGDHKENLYLEAFNLRDGTQEWKVSFDATQTAEKVTNMISRGAPTPVADDNSVYVFFESGDLFGLDHQGRIIWERRIVKEFGKFIGGHGIGTSLVQTPNHLVLSIDHDGPSYIMCVRKETGATVWKSERTSRVSWSTPVYTSHSGIEQIIVSSNGSVDSYNLDSGKQIWTVSGIKGNNTASPTVSGDLVAIGSSNPGDCLAIKLGGAGDVTETHIAWRTSGITSSFGSPLIYRDLVYFVNRAGVLQAVRLKDGSLAWQHRLPASTWASPLATGERLYFFCKDGNTAILSPGESGPGDMIVNELAVEEKDRIYGYGVVSGKFVLRKARELICVGE